MCTEDYAEHCREIARRFLLTAVVVDDELAVVDDAVVHRKLTTPGRGVSMPTAMESGPTQNRSLNVNLITRSFARLGMICGLVSPLKGEDTEELLAKAVARADIVILDWILDRTTGANALQLLKRILTEDQPRRLRLLAFYTGEPDHDKIRVKIVECVNGIDDLYKAGCPSDGSDKAISYRSCRIVVYGKPGSGTRDLESEVDEEKLADRLIADFASMVEGLLPSLVLTALGAVRENVYQLLECFGPDLDPAFLVHRVCLPQPADSDLHIVEQITSELHGIMEDAVGKWRPAGIRAIKLWLEKHFPENEDIVLAPRSKGQDAKRISRGKAIDLLKNGIKESSGPLKKNGSEYDLLSHGFTGGADNSRELDQRLAAVMSFRQVPPSDRRQLSLGTVMVKDENKSGTFLLCVTPQCDSVRLTGTTKFLFLRLTNAKANTSRLVVPVSDTEHRCMTISLNPSQWCQLKFARDREVRCVLAQRNDTDNSFTFKDKNDIAYRWVGELKFGQAQAIAMLIAQRMSRIPLNQSEWLRRS